MVDYLGHGPTDEGQYGIRFRGPEGEQHLGVAKMRPLENEHKGDRLMHVTFHNGSTANVRMPRSIASRFSSRRWPECPSRRSCPQKM